MNHDGSEDRPTSGPSAGMAHEVEIFPWSADFELGVDLLDRQHRVLVDLLNTLAGHLAYQADAPTLDDVLAELRRYTQVHFNDEDALWRDHLGDDPWVLRHEAEHEEFVARLAGFRVEAGERSFDAVIEDIVRFLSRWLALHIIESDMRLVLVIRDLQAGHELPAAHRHADEKMTGTHRVVVDTVMGMVDKLAARAVQLSREIARRRQAEANLQAANVELVRLRDEAERANAAKSDFLANMSHEIRTPLNAITGLAHLIRRGGLSDEQAQRLDALEAAGGHLLEVIDAVLDLSRIDAGRLDLDSQPVSPAAIVAEVATMLRERAEAKGLRIATEVDPLPPALLGDATRLRQALLNYVANALRHTQTGSVTLRLRIEAEEAGHARLRFEVEDTGVGIEPAELARLFNPFIQAGPQGLRRQGGTGLGLAITRRLAGLMGGEAGARSTPGRGSLFWFTVTLAKGTTPAPAGMPAPPAIHELQRAFAGRVVLLAEDEPVNRQIGQMLLEEAGLRVELAEDGDQAVQKAQALRPDLVLMDMQLPRLDGLEATRRLRALPSMAGTPIVAMTANAFDEDRRRCMAAGMDDFVSKPVRPETLYGVVLRWLQRGAGRA